MIIGNYYISITYAVISVKSSNVNEKSAKASRNYDSIRKKKYKINRIFFYFLKKLNIKLYQFLLINIKQIS